MFSRFFGAVVFALCACFMTPLMLLGLCLAGVWAVWTAFDHDDDCLKCWDCDEQTQPDQTFRFLGSPTVEIPRWFCERLGEER